MSFILAGQFEPAQCEQREAQRSHQATLLLFIGNPALSYLFEQGLSLKQAQMICLVQVMQEEICLGFAG